MRAVFVVQFNANFPNHSIQLREFRKNCLKILNEVFMFASGFRRALFYIESGKLFQILTPGVLTDCSF